MLTDHRGLHFLNIRLWSEALWCGRMMDSVPCIEPNLWLQVGNKLNNKN